MRIERDVEISMDDGAVVRADIFRPDGDEPVPVLLTYGPYGKGFSFQEVYADSWRILVERFPDVEQGTSGRHQNWEVVDPEKWVPHGYACVRVDGRGWGRSPGYANPWSPRETKDIHDCVEWAGTQGWSTGKVALIGISYLATNQWHVAASQPPHLAAMVPWEGFADFYRDFAYHGGIPATTPKTWYVRTYERVQHGLGTRGGVSAVTGELVSGPETLTDAELAANRNDWLAEIAAHPLADTYWDDYLPDWSRVTVPFLSAGNWGGAGMHLRGNTEAYVRAASSSKWLELHGLEHWVLFYAERAIALQRQFLDHFLKGADNGWAARPRVLLDVRTVDGFVPRSESSWPLASTVWTPYYLSGSALSTDVPPVAGSSAFASESDGVTFSTPPLAADTEITGPLAATLFVSSSTTDADLFVVLRCFDPDGAEVYFTGAVEPNAPVAQGWLRASHRALDPALSTPYRPYHPHDAVEPLVPGEVYELDIEVWPTSLIVPAGYRLALTVLGRDFDNHVDDSSATLNHFAGWRFTGCGIYTHHAMAGGRTTVHTGPKYPSRVLLPVIP